MTNKKIHLVIIKNIFHLNMFYILSKFKKKSHTPSVINLLIPSNYTIFYMKISTSIAHMETPKEYRCKNWIYEIIWNYYKYKFNYIHIIFRYYTHLLNMHLEIQLYELNHNYFHKVCRLHGFYKHISIKSWECVLWKYRYFSLCTK